MNRSVGTSRRQSKQAGKKNGREILAQARTTHPCILEYEGRQTIYCTYMMLCNIEYAVGVYQESHRTMPQPDTEILKYGGNYESMEIFKYRHWYLYVRTINTKYARKLLVVVWTTGRRNRQTPKRLIYGIRKHGNRNHEKSNISSDGRAERQQ